MTLMEGLPALGAMPGVDELAGGFGFKRAADSDFHIAHRNSSGFIISQISKARPGAPGTRRYHL
jgi:hypothetical protein